MRFFLVSENGDAAGIAWRLKREGHDVSMFIKNPLARNTLKKMVDQVPSLIVGVNSRPDAILFDMVGMGKIADQLREEGRPVIGGGSWNDKMELDRKFSMKLMDNFGINTPRSYAFKNIEEGVNFAVSHKRLLVLKPHDNLNTAFTFVPKTQDELISFMLHLREDMGIDGRILLQEFIQGPEVSTEVWYTQGQPIAYPNSTLETKKLMVGDYGPSTGSQTSVVFNYPVRQPRLVQQTLKKIQPFLERIKYTGPLDINGIVKNGKFYGLEFTPRLGYNAIYAFMRLLDEPLGDVLKRLADGNTTPFKLKTGFGYSLRVSIPPYPYKPEDKMLQKKIYAETANLLIEGISEKEWDEKVFPLDVWLSPHGYYTAGFDGVIMEVTGHGMTPYEAEREAVSLFKKLSLPEKQARAGDGAKIAERRIDELAFQGYEMPRTVMELPIQSMVMVSKEKEKERNNDDAKKTPSKEAEIKAEDKVLSERLNVRPDAFVDPRIASN